MTMGITRLLIFSALSLLLVGLFGFLFLRYLKANELSLTALRLATKMTNETFRFEQQDLVLPYRLYAPNNIQGEVPLVLALQSAYGRGENNLGQLDKVVKKLVSFSERAGIQALVLAPQCPAGLEWINSPPSHPPFTNIPMALVKSSWREQALAELIRQLSAQYPIDTSRIYIVGASMGSTGLWSLLYRYSDLFAGAIAMNGRSDPAIAQYIQSPVWVFHGRDDSIAPVDNSMAMVAALEQQKKNVRFTIVEKGGHQIVLESLHSESLQWLFQQKAKPAENRFSLNAVVVEK